MRNYIDLYNKAEINFRTMKGKTYADQIAIIEENLNSELSDNPDFVFMCKIIKCKIEAQNSVTDAKPEYTKMMLTGDPGYRKGLTIFYVKPTNFVNSQLKEEAAA